MTTFDTSALVPLFDVRHPRREEARAAFRAARTAKLHPCVLAELTTVVRRLAKDRGQDGNKEARNALRALLGQPRCGISTQADYDKAVRRYLSDSALSLTDAIISTMKEPYAFDERILRAASRK